MRAARVQASLRICAVLPEPPLLTHTSSESRGTFRQKARSLAPLNGWACTVKMCHDGMLEDTNLLDGAHILQLSSNTLLICSSENTNCTVTVKTKQNASTLDVPRSATGSHHMSLVTRKPVFRVCEQVRHKPACAVTEARWRLEN